ncbi:hypothetical protein [Streptomyces musisoli]|uniref:hypothetical protein n=1 Tax=Streptomyces musisoli TaxID=2802280 RepID=UPI003557AD94
MDGLAAVGRPVCPDRCTPSRTSRARLTTSRQRATTSATLPAGVARNGTSPASWCRRTVNAVALSPDGKALVTGTDDGTARLWNPATGRPPGGVRRNSIGASRLVRSRRERAADRNLRRGRAPRPARTPYRPVQGAVRRRNSRKETGVQLVYLAAEATSPAGRLAGDRVWSPRSP